MTSISVGRQATMNIRKRPTALSRADPFKRMFRTAFDYLPYHSRGHVVAGIGEFIGTMFFYFMAFSGAQVAFIAQNKTSDGEIDTSMTSVTPSMLLYISLAAGFSLAVTAWIFYRISGGLFNPVVSVGMVLIGALTIARGVLLIVVQTAGVIVAAYMVNALFPGGLNVGTALHPEVSTAQGVLIEMLLTSQLVFTIFMLAAEKHEASFLAPVGIGLSAFIAELIGVFWTGGSLNPARSLAPAIVTRDFPPEHWIYWVGPLAGSILAVILYKLIKALEYETAQSDDSGLGEREGLPTTRSETDERKPSSVFALSSVKPGDEEALQFMGSGGRYTTAQPSVPPKDTSTGEAVMVSSQELNSSRCSDGAPLACENFEKPRKDTEHVLKSYSDKAIPALAGNGIVGSGSAPMSPTTSQHDKEPSLKSISSSMMRRLHMRPMRSPGSDGEEAALELEPPNHAPLELPHLEKKIAMQIRPKLRTYEDKAMHPLENGNRQDIGMSSSSPQAHSGLPMGELKKNAVPHMQECVAD